MYKLGETQIENVSYMLNVCLICIYSRSDWQCWNKSTGQASKRREAKNSRWTATAKTRYSTIMYWLLEAKWSFTNQHQSSFVYIY